MTVENPRNSDSAPATPLSFSRPRPRPPRSPAQTEKIRIQNRRREYLDKNPNYFTSAEHEFADPDLYDILVRRFQTPTEREAEGRSRGWGKTLESSLMRGEARLDRLASSYTGDRPAPTAPKPAARMRETIFTIDSDLTEEKPTTKQEGRARWEEFLRERFVQGGDDEFDYGKVDGNDDLNSMENRDKEEEWFDDEEPEWADDSDEDEDDGGVDMKEDMHGTREKTRPKRERVLMGQTGVQDY